MNVEYRDIAGLEGYLCWGTAKQNMADKSRHGTALVGSRVYGAKHTEDDVIEVCRLRATGLKQSEVAERMGMGQTDVSAILCGKRWKHVPRAVAPKQRVTDRRKGARINLEIAKAIVAICQSGVSQGATARQFGISPANVRMILLGKIWPEATGKPSRRVHSLE
jgi:hypothetical protein